MQFTGDGKPSLSFAASDGRDFLVVWQRHTKQPGLPYAQGGLYGQRIVGGEARPAFFVDGDQTFSNAAVVWTGSHYLVASPHRNGLFIVVISPEGHVIRRSERPAIAGGYPQPTRMVVNGDRVLVAAYLSPFGTHGVLLDRNGDVVVAQKILHVRYGCDIAAAGDAFALAGFGPGTVLVMRIDRQGNVGTPTTVNGPITARDPQVAWLNVTGNDSKIVVAWVGVKFDTPSSLYSAVVGLDGKIVTPARVIFAMPPETKDSGLRLVRMVADGAQFLALLGISLDPFRDIHASDPAVLRLTADGAADGQPDFLIRGIYLKDPADIALSATSRLVSWESRTALDEFGSFFTLIPRRRNQTDAAAPQQLGRSMAVQEVRGAGARGSDRLIAWNEEGQVGMRLSIVGPTGAMIKTEAFPIIDPHAMVSIASDGVNWLVAWASREYALAMLLDANLTRLTESVVSVWGIDSVSASWNGKAYVLASTYEDLVIAKLSPDGRKVTRQTILRGTVREIDNYATSYWNATAASLDDGTLITFDELLLSPLSPFGGGTSGWVTTKAVRVDENGIPTTPLMVLVEGDAFRVLGTERAVAADGQQYLVIWREQDQLRGMFLTRQGAERPMSRFVLNTSGRNPQLAWDGNDFVAIWNDDDHSVGAARISPAGLVFGRQSLRVPDDETIPAAILAAGPGSSPMIAVTERSVAFDDLWRAGLLFLSDFDSPDTVPEPPAIMSAVPKDDGIDLTWARQRNALGYAIEGLGRDGLSRVIELARAEETSAHVSFDLFEPAAIRLRSWNATGRSAPSPSVPVGPFRRRAVARP
jgi:hypothetical protein